MKHSPSNLSQKHDRASNELRTLAVLFGGVRQYFEALDSPRSWWDAMVVLLEARVEVRDFWIAALRRDACNRNMRITQ